MIENLPISIKADDADHSVSAADGSSDQHATTASCSLELLLETAGMTALTSHLSLVARLQGLDPELVNLKTEEAAIFLRCKKKTLEAQRTQGEGPGYQKNKNLVTYSLASLLRYTAANTRLNTCITAEERLALDTAASASTSSKPHTFGEKND